MGVVSPLRQRDALARHRSVAALVHHSAAGFALIAAYRAFETAEDGASVDGLPRTPRDGRAPWPAGQPALRRQKSQNEHGCLGGPDGICYRGAGCSIGFT
jgi:hypothetical protein